MRYDGLYLFIIYSRLSNKHGGWNEYRGGAKVVKSLNIEVGINIFWKKLVHNSNRGYRDGRLCRPDSEQRPLVSNFDSVAIVKLCCHNFTQIANFMIFFVSAISYRPTDLSLLKEFSKNVNF